MNRQFKGVWVPKEIYLNENLSWTEKILLIEIHSLQGEEGCWASNQYLAEFLGIKEASVKNMLSKLKTMGYIKVEQLRHPRRITVNPNLWFSRSQKSDVTESTSQKSDLTSQKSDLTSQKSDVAIYRNNNTENNTAVIQAAAADNAYLVYRKYCKKMPLNIFNQERLQAITEDLDTFERVMEIWVGRQYQEQNITGIIGLFEKLKAEQAPNGTVDLFCDKCRVDSGWLEAEGGWVRCKH